MSVDEEYLQQLMRTISHDMGGALRVAVGFSKLIAENYEDVLDEKAIHWLSMIKNDGERTQEKLIALSRYARLYGISDSRSQCDLNALCSRAIDISSLGEFYPHFNVSLGELPVLMGYERLWVDFFCEVLVNSAKYAKENADIECRVYSDIQDDSLCIVVEDDGVGLTRKQMETALMPFRVVDGVSNAGVGMGIPIVKRIAELQGGKFVITQSSSSASGDAGLRLMVVFPSDLPVPS